MPGVLGGITGILVTGAVGSQLGGIVTTVVLAFITGRVTGMALDLLGTKAVLYSDTEEFFVTDSAGEFASEAPETIPGWDPAVTVSSKN